MTKVGRFAGILEEVKELQNSGRKLKKEKVLMRELHNYSGVEIREVRLQAKMTQSIFAFVLGVSKKTVEAWEGGRSKPTGSALRLLGLIADNPNFAEDNKIIVRELV